MCTGGTTPLVPKPLTSNSKADGRFDTRDNVKMRPLAVGAPEHRVAIAPPLLGLPFSDGNVRIRV